MGTIIHFVQLESSAFLTDPDFMRMNCEQRGVYCSLIFLLYCNNGELQVDGTANGKPCSKDIGSLCNDYDIENSIEIVLSKFNYANGLLSHKRVTEELKKARDFSEVKRQAGLKGAKKRWHSHSTANSTTTPPVIAKVSKVKEKKVKEKKVKESKEKFVPPTLKQIQQYIKEKNYTIDSKTFLEYFTESNWIDSKGNPVKNWKQKIITWSSHARNPQNNQGHGQQDRRESFANQTSAYGETILPDD